MSSKKGLHFYIGSSDESSSVRSGTLSITALVVGLSVSLLLFTFALLGTYFIGVTSYYYAKVIIIDNHTEEIQSSIDQYYTSLSNFNDSLTTLLSVEDSTLLVSGLSLIDRDIRLSGIGGEPSIVSLTTEHLGSPKVREMAMITQKLSQIDRQIALGHTTIVSANDYNQTRQEYYKDLPSIWPVGGREASSFGVRYHPVLGIRKMHEGLDLANPRWTPIVAPANGVVSFKGVRGGYGKVVILKHLATGLETRYAHMQKAAVEKGQSVYRGSVIGYVGNTGRSTGPHLHYEVRENGLPVNPKRYLLDSTLVME